MQHPSDKFWQHFFIGVFGATLLVVLVLIMLTPYSSLPTDVGGVEHVSTLLLSQASTSAAQEEPPRLPSAPSNFYYRDGISAGAYSIAWMTEQNWQSTEQVYEGDYAAQATFKEPWSGLGLGSETLRLTADQSLSFALRIESGITSMNIELYNANGGVVATLPLSAYLPGRAIATNTWQVVTVPLAELGFLPSNTVEFALVAAEPGVAYLDNIQLLPN